MPEKAGNYKKVYWYLITVRGIESEIVSALMNEKKIYQDSKHGNCVFVGYDEAGAPKYCSLRGTHESKAFKMGAVNSDKSYPFVIGGRGNLLFVCESPIDVMSHASLSKLFGQDWREDLRISLGCTWDAHGMHMGWSIGALFAVALGG